MATFVVRDQHLPLTIPQGLKRISLRPYRVSYQAQTLGAEDDSLEALKAAAKVADATGFAVLTYDPADVEED